MNPVNESSDGSGTEHHSGFAVMRIQRWYFDDPARLIQHQNDLESWLSSAVMPVRIHSTRDFALSEAERLNQVNADKNSIYYVIHTRLPFDEWTPTPTPPRT